LSVSSARAGPLAEVAVISTNASARASLVIVVLPAAALARAYD
jgi:hypothetical protein